MKKFFIEKENLHGDFANIVGDEFFHLSKVLRCQEGEIIGILSGDEFLYTAEITKIQKDFAECKIINKEFCLANPKYNITVFQGLPKGEKLEMIIQKISELGAKTLIPFESNFTIAKNNITKMDRLTKIARETCKQCGRSVPLKIENTIKIIEIPVLVKKFDLVIFLYENASVFNTLNSINEKIAKANNIAIIVGSEGGFSQEENDLLIKENLEQISLGKRVLRTETASIALVGYISLLKNN